jgi:hypothetical protein
MLSPRAEIQRTLGRARERLAEPASKMQERVRAFRAGHAHVYGAATLGLLLALGVVGAGAAVLVGMVSRPNPTMTNYNEHYVLVTGPNGTKTLTVTRPGKGKRVPVETVVRRRVVRGPGGVSTLFESVAVPGPSQTETVAGGTKTVIVTGPGQTVTQVVTQIVTEVVTSEVTVTETVNK